VKNSISLTFFFPKRSNFLKVQDIVVPLIDQQATENDVLSFNWSRFQVIRQKQSASADKTSSRGKKVQAHTQLYPGGNTQKCWCRKKRSPEDDRRGPRQHGATKDGAQVRHGSHQGERVGIATSPMA